MSSFGCLRDGVHDADGSMGRAWKRVWERGLGIHVIDWVGLDRVS